MFQIPSEIGIFKVKMHFSSDGFQSIQVVRSKYNQHCAGCTNMRYSNRKQPNDYRPTDSCIQYEDRHSICSGFNFLLCSYYTIGIFFQPIFSINLSNKRIHADCRYSPDEKRVKCERNYQSLCQRNVVLKGQKFTFFISLEEFKRLSYLSMKTLNWSSVVSPSTFFDCLSAGESVSGLNNWLLGIDDNYFRVLSLYVCSSRFVSSVIIETCGVLRRTDWPPTDAGYLTTLWKIETFFPAQGFFCTPRISLRIVFV